MRQEAINNRLVIDGGPWPNFTRDSTVPVTSIPPNGFTAFGIDVDAVPGLEPGTSSPCFAAAWTGDVARTGVTVASELVPLGARYGGKLSLPEVAVVPEEGLDCKQLKQRPDRLQLPGVATCAKTERNHQVPKGIYTVASITKEHKQDFQTIKRGILQATSSETEGCLTAV